MNVKVLKIVVGIVLSSVALQAQQPQEIVFISPFPDSVSRLISFDTDFESGSLQKVELLDASLIKISARDSVWHLSYNLYSQPDPVNPVDNDLVPSARWFYFRMIGVKNKQLYLNFFQTDPVRPMFSYDGQSFQRLNAYECVVEPRREGERGRNRQVKVRFERDTVYLAYFTPYTLSYLQKRIVEWQATGNVTDLETIGHSFRGVPMNMMTITDPSVPDAQKKRIYIHGRTHTSESPSSWHLDGLLDAITANTPQGEAYRRQMVFYVLPFTNPDGVVEGLSRSGAHGVNLEVNYNRPDSLTVAEVNAIKSNLERLTAERPLDMVLNMHSQVESTATYWVHTAQGSSQEYFRNQLLLANLTMFQNPWFGKKDLSFSEGGDRYVEGWVWNRFQERTLAITFETPYTYYQLNPDGDWVTTENLRTMGGKLLNAVGSYLLLSFPDHTLAFPEKPKKMQQWEQLTSRNDIYFGDFFYEPKHKNAKITYTSPFLPAGHYQIFRWIPGKTVEISPQGSNEWAFLEDYVHIKEGVFKKEYKAFPNRVENALLILPKLPQQ